MSAIKIGLVGVGKIARDRHVPAMRQIDAVELVATASLEGALDDVPAFTSVEAMLESVALDAITVCTPPNARLGPVLPAIDAGIHVMLEKPPGATLSQVEAMRKAAQMRGVTLFTTWHSRETLAVGRAREWLKDKDIQSVAVRWMENVRQWHPGQEWIFAPGGFGVFDPGINALSVLTAILPEHLVVEGGTMSVPKGRSGPCCATMAMRCGQAPVSVELDFLHPGDPVWDIDISTAQGPLSLTSGGHILHLPAEAPIEGPNEEYQHLYRRFADLVATGQSEIDTSPLMLVADAFLLSDRSEAPSFTF